MNPGDYIANGERHQLREYVAPVRNKCKMRQLAWLISVIPVFYCAANAETQASSDSISADQTIEYIDNKIKGRTTDSGNVKVNGVKLKGTVLAMYSITTIDLGGLGSEISVAEDEIDLRQVEDFTPFQQIQLLKEDHHMFYLSCGRGYGKCAVHISCEPTESRKCSGTELKKTFGFDLDTSATDGPEEEVRVKKALFHLKSIFPFVKKIELFDDK